MSSSLSQDQPSGVSVVICCHNSAARLPETLACLARQERHVGIPWEVIVVDNASTDDTSEVARACWPQNPPAPLRVVNEPEPGLSNARIRGFDTARYEFVSFVDDDNRVSPQWIAKVMARMRSDPEIGACGGRVKATHESVPPPWWDEYAGRFAVGDQWAQEGDISNTRGWLYGAGLTVRVSAWRHLVAGGFQFRVKDRCGKALTSGGDNELCYALRLAGWKLWLDWSLSLDHFIPSGRMTWAYLRGLHRGVGIAYPVLSAYDSDVPETLTDELRETWWWQTLRTLRQLISNRNGLLSYFFRLREDKEVLPVDFQLGVIAQLLRMRGEFARTRQEIRLARWRKPVAEKNNASSPSKETHISAD